MTATIITVWLLIGQTAGLNAAPFIVVGQLATAADCESLRKRIDDTFTIRTLRCFETRIVR